MAEMAWIEKAFCRSAAWRAFTRKVVVPWALQGCEPQGIALEIGAGSGAMAAEILSLHPRLEMVVTDFDESMLSGARETLAQFSERAEIRTADATASPSRSRRSTRSFPSSCFITLSNGRKLSARLRGFSSPAGASSHTTSSARG